MTTGTTTTGMTTTAMMTMTDSAKSDPGLVRRLVVPFMVTAASLAVLLFIMGGAVKPATSTPPSTAGSAPQTTVAQPPAAGQPRVSGLDAAVQRVLADSGASQVVAPAQLRRIPDSVVAVLRAERTALTVGK